MADNVELKREDIGIVGNFVKCMREYVNFKGRADRYEYWSFVLCRDLILSVVAFICGYFSNTWILSIASALFVLPYLGVLARRMHDQDKSLKKYLLMPFIMFALFMFIVFIGGMLGYIYGTAPRWIEIVTQISAFIVGIVLIYVVLSVLFYTVRCGKMEDNKYGPKIPFDKKLNEKGRIVMIVYLIYYLFIIGIGNYLAGLAL